MNDEYGAMDSSGQHFKVDKFTLENGVILKEAQVQNSNALTTLNSPIYSLSYLFVCETLFIMMSDMLQYFWNTKHCER